MNIAVTTEAERKLRAISSIAYAMSILCSVIFFERHASFLSEGEFIVLIPYILVVLFSAVTAYKLSHWYLPVENIQPKLEIFLVPIAVILIPSFCAGISFSIAKAAIENKLEFIDILRLSIFSSAMFVIIAWPVLLLSTIATSIAIATYQKALLRGN